MRSPLSARQSRCCQPTPSTAPPVAAPGHAPPPRPTLRHRFHQCCDAADASPPGCQGSIVRPPLCRGLVCVYVCGATTVECRRGMSMCAACGHRHLATCVCSCNMMIIEVTHALLAPGARATDRSPFAAPRRRAPAARGVRARPEIARAQRRSSPRGPMLPLVAWLERQLTRGIWPTVDHPNPKN